MGIRVPNLVGQVAIDGLFQILTRDPIQTDRIRWTDFGETDYFLFLYLKEDNAKHLEVFDLFEDFYHENIKNDKLILPVHVSLTRGTPQEIMKALLTLEIHWPVMSPQVSSYYIDLLEHNPGGKATLVLTDLQGKVLAEAKGKPQIENLLQEIYTHVEDDRASKKAIAARFSES